MQDPVVVYPRGSVWGGSPPPNPVLSFGETCLRGVPLSQVRLTKKPPGSMSVHALAGYGDEIVEPPFNYIIRAFGFLKVGFCAFDPRKRIAGIQTSCPGEIIVDVIMGGDRDDERRLHERLSPYRVQGEWFRITPQIEDMIRLFQGEGSADLGPASIIPGRERAWKFACSPAGERAALRFDPSPYHYLLERPAPSPSQEVLA